MGSRAVACAANHRIVEGDCSCDSLAARVDLIEKGDRYWLLRTCLECGRLRSALVGEPPPEST